MPYHAGEPARNPQEAESATKIGMGPVNVQIALPKWAIICISILSVGLAAAISAYATYIKLSAMHQDAIQQALDRQERRKIEKMSALLIPMDKALEFQEQQKHQGDDGPEEQESKREELRQDGSVTIHHFFRDGCIQIVRKSPGLPTRTDWIFGSSVKPDLNAMPKVHASLPLPRPMGQDKLHRNHRLDLVSFDNSKPATLRGVGYQGRCMDPHPGVYTFQNQQLNQCIVQQTRFFQDGCVHTQLFNACTGSWDVYPNGAPRVNWMRCVH